MSSEESLAAVFRRACASAKAYEDYYWDAGFRPRPGSVEHDLFRRVELLERVLDATIKELAELRQKVNQQGECDPSPAQKNKDAS